MNAGPTIIKADLPYPDAVIVREPDGTLYVVAHESWSDEDIARCVREAPHLRNGLPIG